MEDFWLNRAKRIMALAQTGLGFSTDPFDRDRYDELARIAAEMMGEIGQVPPDRVLDLVPDYAASYATPSLDVRGALIEDGQILLVQEKSDGKWAMPGGFADIGWSAAENVVKEVLEEASISVRASRLYELRHKAKHGYPADTRDFYKIYFLLERDDRHPPAPGDETAAVGFFAPDALPPLSLSRVIPSDIDAAFAAAKAPQKATRFD